jgi:hypothetical protein
MLLRQLQAMLISVQCLLQSSKLKLPFNGISSSAMHLGFFFAIKTDKHMLVKQSRDHNNIQFAYMVSRHVTIVITMHQLINGVILKDNRCN